MEKSNILFIKEDSLKAKKGAGSSCPNFLKKTYEIVDCSLYNDLIAWEEDGASFVIKKPKEFAEQILPIYFKHNNLTSFVRQLNMYEFKKRKNKNYDYIIHHNHFRRGFKEELPLIKRRLRENILIFKKNKLNLEEMNQDTESLIKECQKDLHLKLKYLDEQSERLQIQQQSLSQTLKKQSDDEETLVQMINTIAHFYDRESVQQVLMRPEGSFYRNETSQKFFLGHDFSIRRFPTQNSSIPGCNFLRSSQETGDYVPNPNKSPIGFNHENNYMMQKACQIAISQESLRNVVQKPRKTLDNTSADLPEEVGLKQNWASFSSPKTEETVYLNEHSSDQFLASSKVVPSQYSSSSPVKGRVDEGFFFNELLGSNSYQSRL